ncbi:dynein heavy chain 1, cytosolic [Puccinia sorghi]|uniref:Dynein heavy chain 1, cytosolic n=1 Tax=Puccinia sorghi TaxID=27349 RepID=A0A0L6UKN5_9BASI|nr:dynein heavy chain 1, cytosolic [Puccinia sorghi]
MVLKLADGTICQGCGFGVTGKSVSSECVFQTGASTLIAASAFQSTNGTYFFYSRNAVTGRTSVIIFPIARWENAYKNRDSSYLWSRYPSANAEKSVMLAEFPQLSPGSSPSTYLRPTRANFAASHRVKPLTNPGLGCRNEIQPNPLLLASWSQKTRLFCTLYTPRARRSQALRSKILTILPSMHPTIKSVGQTNVTETNATNAHTASKSANNKDDSKMGIPMTKKKFAEDHLDHPPGHPKLDSLFITSRLKFLALTLDILKTAKRYHTTVSFLADTGLKEASDNVHIYNLLMKDFPLNELLAATDLEKIQESLVQIFGSTRNLRFRRFSCCWDIYPLPLAEAISKDLTESLLKVLTNHRLMFMEHDSFSKIMSAAAAINASHNDLKKRCEYLKGFRKQHEQLRIMNGRDQGISRHLGELTDLDMEEEVRAAYESVKDVDVLDASPEGTQIWTTAEAAYNERVSRVENQIIARLKARLGSARNATEMFRLVDSMFQDPDSSAPYDSVAGFFPILIPFLFAQKSEELSKNIKLNSSNRLRKISTNFMINFVPKSAPKDIVLNRSIDIRELITCPNFGTYLPLLAQSFGLAKLSGSVYLHEASRRRARTSSNFLKKLDTKPIFDQWVQDWNKRSVNISGPLFEIQRNRSTESYTLIVAFNPDVIVIFKEVRNTTWLEYNVPYQMNSSPKDAKKVYPGAVSLMESIRTYTQTLTKVHNGGISDLLADYQNELCQLTSRGLNMRWENVVGSIADLSAPGSSMSSRMTSSNDRESGVGRQSNYVRELANKVSIFQKRTDDLLFIYRKLFGSLFSICIIFLMRSSFSVVAESSSCVILWQMDDLSMAGYLNLQQWTNEIDQMIEMSFLERLECVIKHGANWVEGFGATGPRHEKTVKFNLTTKSNNAEDTTSSKVCRFKMETYLIVTPLVHEIRIKNQVIYLDAPVEFVRANWYKELHQWLGVMCRLPHLQSQRYDLGLKLRDEDTGEKTYLSLMGKFADETLQRPYALIEEKLGEIWRYRTTFTEDWESHCQLGSKPFPKFAKLARHLTTRSPRKIQAKVNAKYDMWQKDVLNITSSKLPQPLKRFHSSRSSKISREKLRNGDRKSRSSAVERKPCIVRDTNFPVIGYVDQIEGEWNVFNDLLQRKNLAIQDQLERILSLPVGLQMKIVAKDKVVQSKIEVLLADWDKEKPISGELKPDIAMNSIINFQTQVQRLQDEYKLRWEESSSDFFRLEHGFDQNNWRKEFLALRIKKVSQLSKVLDLNISLPGPKLYRNKNLITGLAFHSMQKLSSQLPRVRFGMTDTWTNLSLMRRTDKDESVGEALNQAKTSSSSSQPAWMRQLETTENEFLKNLNENFPAFDAGGNDINYPLLRFFDQEVSPGQKLLRVIRKDLNELIGVSNGEIKQTNHLRSLIGEITKAVIPSHWKRYKANSFPPLLLLILSATPAQIDSSPSFSASASIDRLIRFATDSNCPTTPTLSTLEILQTTIKITHSRSFTLSSSRWTTIQSSTPPSSSSNAYQQQITLSRLLDNQLHFLNLFGPASNQIGLASSNQDGAGESSKEIIKSSHVTSSQSNPYEELHNLPLANLPPFRCILGIGTWICNTSIFWGPTGLKSSQQQALSKMQFACKQSGCSRISNGAVMCREDALKRLTNCIPRSVGPSNLRRNCGRMANFLTKPIYCTLTIRVSFFFFFFLSLTACFAAPRNVSLLPSILYFHGSWLTTLDLDKPESFRQLDLPMGPQTESRKCILPFF